MATIPGVVVVISAVFAVAGVVLAIVGHEVLQGEAVMSSDEVDGMVWFSSVVLEEV